MTVSRKYGVRFRTCVCVLKYKYVEEGQSFPKQLKLKYKKRPVLLP